MEVHSQHSQEMYRTIFEDSPEPIFISGPDSKIIGVNQAALDLFGFTREQAMGSDVGDRFVDPADQERFRQAVMDGGGSVQDFEVRLLGADGVEMYCLIKAMRRNKEEGSSGGIFGFVREVTERKRAEESLRESEGRFRAVAQSANDAIVSADTRGNIVFWNKAASNIFGYAEKEVLGQSLAMLMPERYREDHERGLKRYEITGEPHIIGQVLELEGLKKDGAEFPLELSVANWKTGEGSFVTAFIRDITERKESERALRESEIMLRQREKMAQLGTLSAGVAHELNNPVAAISSSAGHLQSILGQLGELQLRWDTLALTEPQRMKLRELMQLAKERAFQPLVMDTLDRSDKEGELESFLKGEGLTDVWKFTSALVEMGYDSSKVRALTDTFDSDQLSTILSCLTDTYTAHSLSTTIGQASERITNIVKALKSYTYLDQDPILGVDIHEGLDNTLLIMRSKLEPNITVHREYSLEVPKIHAYGSELNQVWTNILDNAADAVEGEGEIVLRTRRDGDCVVVEIEDNGHGIPEKIQTRVYDAFFTTKAPGHGTGLGLNISYNIVVQKHRGSIRLLSQPGKTIFRVQLPINFQAIEQSGNGEEAGI